MPFYFTPWYVIRIRPLSASPSLLCTHIHPPPCPTFLSIPFICTQHIPLHLSWPVSFKKKKKKHNFFSFSLRCSMHRPDPHPPLETHPPVSLHARNPTHLLSPALSWGLINLVKSQSAFHSITITLYPVWCSMLGGIRMITFRIRSASSAATMASHHSSNIMIQWWRARPPLRSEQIES